MRDELKGAVIGIGPIMVYVGYLLIQAAMAYHDHPCRFVAERRHLPALCSDLAACPEPDYHQRGEPIPCTQN